MRASSEVVAEAPAVHDKANRTFIIKAKTVLETLIRQSRALGTGRSRPDPPRAWTASEFRRYTSGTRRNPTQPPEKERAQVVVSDAFRATY
jgi:hypothetical protein